MDNSKSGSIDGRQNGAELLKSDDNIQHLLSAEEQLLQSISSHAPLPGVLNEICSALDCQIGNVVSLISLPQEEGSDLAALAMNATLFGLYTFFSEGLVAENGEPLGSLEMFSSIPRSPSANECGLIQRAKCLAALAIKLDHEAGHQEQSGRKDQSVPGRVLDWPVAMN